ncbi:MAG: AAA family ATPase [Rubrivivax sp.]|nr:AAA family ATPase [Rubrivivax sp.]MDP3610572.1 AAA family ATPase [Rubrivivax sp.]
MSRRLDSLRRAGPSYDPATPPPNTKLTLGVVASRVGVSVTVMAEHTGISRTAIANLLSNNWPVHTPREELTAKLLALMEERGATDTELATLFHAFGRQTGTAGKAQPRGPDERAPQAPTTPSRNPNGTNPEDNDMLPLKAVLTPKARKHFAIFRNPFDGPVNSEEQMYLGDDFVYVRESAWQCAQTSGFVAVVGESGAGKTTVLEDMEARLQANSDRIILIKPSVVGMEQDDNKGKTLKSADVMHAIVARLQPDRPVPQTDRARSDRAKKLLIASAAMGNAHLVVIEEAHCMPDATLKHLKRMNELRDGRRSLLGILLLGQPELKRRLADGLRDGTLREVAQRCEVVELLPLDGCIKPYLERRASAAGVPLARIVDEDGIQALRDRLTRGTGRAAVSMCYPLAVSNLLVMAMNDAADVGSPTVTADIVRDCGRRAA